MGLRVHERPQQAQQPFARDGRRFLRVMCPIRDIRAHGLHGEHVLEVEGRPAPTAATPHQFPTYRPEPARAVLAKTGSFNPGEEWRLAAGRCDEFWQRRDAIRRNTPSGRRVQAARSASV